MKKIRQTRFSKLFGLLIRLRHMPLLLLLILAMNVKVVGQVQGNIQGVAPVVFPTGGFGVDGDGRNNFPATTTPPYSTAGDWFSSPPFTYPGPSGLNTIYDMFTSDPFDFNTYPQVISVHLNDPWNGDDLTIFTGSNKINDDPNTYTWGPGQNPPKNEIANAAAVFTWGISSNSDDLWCLFFADRMRNNGDAYIDFEFLQHPLILNGNIVPGTIGGTFSSTAPHGGRTVGDILLTIEFSNGGNYAIGVIRKWTEISLGVYQYVVDNSYPTDAVFISSNTAPMTAPWSPYGQTNYLTNQTAEGAINLSVLMDVGPSDCGFISTVFIRTRSSGESSTAELKDFPGAPYEVDINLSDLAIICPNNESKAACTPQSTINTDFANWLQSFSYENAIGTVNETFSPVNPVAPNACGGSSEVTYTVTDDCNPEGLTCTKTYSVAAPTSITFTAPTPETDYSCDLLTQSAVNNAFNAWVTAQTTALNIQGGCAPYDVSNNSASQTIPLLCAGGSTTVTWTIVDLCETKTASATYTLIKPVAITFTAPTPETDYSCELLTQSAVNNAFNAWVTAQTAALNIQGGCPPYDVTNDAAAAPVLCDGGAVTITWTIVDLCETKTTSATYTLIKPVAITFTAPTPETDYSCDLLTQSAVNNAFNAWVTAQTAALNIQGGCPPYDVTNDAAAAPVLCDGGAVTVTWTIVDLCETKTTSATYTLIKPVAITFTAPTPETDYSCDLLTQSAVNNAFNAWVTAQTNALNIQGGCAPYDVTNNAAGRVPILCDGGAVTVTWTIVDLCETKTASATYTLIKPVAITFTAPSPETDYSCDLLTQSAVNNAFNAWVTAQTAALNIQGGCAPYDVSNNAASQTIPLLCAGGSATVTWTIVDLCETKTASATYTLIKPVAITFTAPTPETDYSCDLLTQSAVNNAFNAWVTAQTTALNIQGGCAPYDVSNNSASQTIPLLCAGGSTTVTWTIVDLCETKTASATYTLIKPLAITFTAPSSETDYSCDLLTQSAVNNAFNVWVTAQTNALNIQGGCAPYDVTNDAVGRAPVLCDGGAVTVTWTIVDLCETKTTSATYTLIKPVAITFTAPSSETDYSCDLLTQSAVNNAFNAWVTAQTAALNIQGGCTPYDVTNDAEGRAPVLCDGGAVTVTWTIVDLCETKTTSATYTLIKPVAITFTAPSPETDYSCDLLTQSAVNNAFNVWVTAQTAALNIQGGCTPYDVTNDAEGRAPVLCDGGAVTVTWTIVDLCETKTASATYTLIKPVAITFTAPSPETDYSCDLLTQSAVNNAFNAWVTAQTNALNIQGGCPPYDVTNDAAGRAPILCAGGTVTVTWTIIDLCESYITSADFSLIAPDPVVITPVSNIQRHACDLDDQEAANLAFEEWLEGFIVTGGCDPMVETDAPAAPSYCGGSTTVTWIISDLCLGQVQHSATFTILEPDPIQVTEPDDVTISSCAFTDQSMADWAFYEWLDDFQVTGGCLPGIDISSRSIGIDAPSYCGGSTTVTWVVTDHCFTATEYTATFTITQPDPVVVTEVDDQTINACVFHNQNEAESAFFDWLNDFSVTGGCDPEFYNGMPEAPYYCGGSTVVTWTVTDQCYNTSDYIATYTILAPSHVTAHVPDPVEMPACSSQADIAEAYSTWLDGFYYEGGCNPYANKSEYGNLSDLHCGGSIFVDYYVSDDCTGYDYKYSTFSVAYPPEIIATAPADQHLASCTSYEEAVAAFNTWKAGFTFTGGCNAEGYLFTYPSLSEILCGGTITGYYDVYDDCWNYDNAVSTFSIGAPTPIEATGPEDVTLSACTTWEAALEAYDTFMAGFSFTGGCNGVPGYLIDGDLEDIMCGGTLEVGYYVLGDCGGYDEVYAYFTISDAPYPQANGPEITYINACTSYGDIESAYTGWLSQFNFTGGCNTIVYSTPPSLTEGIECGGTISYNYEVGDECGHFAEITRDFTVYSPTPVQVNCPSAVNINECTPLGDIQTAYNNWKNGFSFTGGCNTNDNKASIPLLPANVECVGANLSFTYTVSSSCETPKTCTSTFNYSAPPAVNVTGPYSVNATSCDYTDQDALNQAFAAWKAQFQVIEDGCGVTPTDLSGYIAPPICAGGTIEITYTAADNCTSDSHTASFTITPDNTDPVFTACPTSPIDLGMNPTSLPNEYMAIEDAGAVTDDCSVGIVATPGDITGDCILTQVWTVTATDYCLNQSVCEVTYTWSIPCEVYCTLTQGFYGTPGGSYCDGRSTDQLLTDLLAPGTITVGGATNYITLSTGQIQCIYAKLPGGGPSKALRCHTDICSIPSNMLNSDGSLKNSLASQAITMALNMRLDSELGALVLATNYFYTLNSTECNSENAQPIPGTEHAYTLNANIMTALGSDRTVNHLMAIANSALNGDPVGVNLGELSNVLGMLNSALDQCKFIVFCDNPCSATQSAQISIDPLPSTSENVTLSIVPNPFKDQTEIRYTLPEDSRVSLEVYNLYGAKIATVFEGVAKAGFDYTYTFNAVGNNSEQVFLVVLRTNSGIITRRIVNTY